MADVIPKQIIRIIYFISVILVSSCAKLPVQTIALTDAIIEEGERMHELNISLLNKMFDGKREKIDSFIKNEYTSNYLKNFIKEAPPETDFQKEFPDIIQSIVPELNSTRDLMQRALEEQRIKLITKLNIDYNEYAEASYELKKLLESVVKVDEERKRIIEKIGTITNNKIDLNNVESEIDKFIGNAGNVSERILKMNNSINSLINN